jgi:ABC-2 type transport system permease protein
VSTWFKKMRTLVSVQHAVMLAYRAEIYLWVLAHLLPFIMMSIWTKAAASGGGAGGSNFSMTPIEYARYFFAVFVVRQFTAVWFIYDFEWQVMEGRLSYYLLRPMHAIWNFVAAHLGEQVARFPFFVVIAALFFCIYPKALWMPSAGSVVFGVVAIYAAFAVRFAMQSCIGMLTFWYERATSLDQLSMVPYFFLSGMIIPLDDFPPRVAAWVRLTPFPYFVDFPARIITGRLGVTDAGLYAGFGIMALWFGVFFLTARTLWKRGLRQYAGQGA